MPIELNTLKFDKSVTHVRYFRRIYSVSEKSHKILLKSFTEYKSKNLAKRASTELQKDADVVLRKVA